eukprot:495738_1
MSTILSLLLTLITIISISNGEEEIPCDSDTGTCAANANDNTLTLGQKLLRKQTELYHLNQLSYPEETAAQSIKIYNPNPETYDYYWFDTYRNKGIYKGRLRSMGMTATNSYRSHIFYFTEQGTDNEIYRITVTKNINDYIIPPSDENIKQQPFYIKLQEKIDFFQDYFERTGAPWISSYNRPPPVLHMYNENATDEIGTIYNIKSSNSFWKCIPDSSLSKQEQIQECQGTNDVSINIEVVSVTPKMFVIENIISESEAELVKQVARPKLHRSGTGQAIDANHNDETRTSKTAWLSYSEHVIIDTIFKRTADILQIDEQVLKNNAEHMQSVFYEMGQEYKAHHDFSDNGRDEASRYITILFYLNEQQDELAGGETWFPKAREGKGIKAHPGKGNAVLFYDLLADGNGDDLTLHEAVKVNRGTKWICNFWVWDPIKPFK